MATEVERLIATLEVRLNKQEQLFKSADKTFRRLELRGSVAEKAINAALGKIGLGLSLAGIQSFAQNAIHSLAEIDRSAKRLGISTDSFQAFRQQFKLAGGDVETAERALAKFEITASETANGGTNALSRLFKENGVSLKNNLTGELKKADEQLYEFAKLVTNAADQQTKLRLAAEVFGSKIGPTMIAPLEKLATQGLPAFVQAMKDAGHVIDGEILSKAAKIEHEWTSMLDRLTLAAKGWAVNTVQAIGETFDKLAYKAMLASELKTAQPKLESLDALIAEAQAYKDTKQVKKLRGEYNALLDDVEARAKGFRDASDRASKAELDRETARGKGFNLLAKPEVKTTKTTDFFKNTSGAAAKEQEQFQKRIDSLKKETAAILAETAAQAQLNPLIDDYGYAADKASVASKLLSEAQDNHIPITNELKASIEKLAAAHALAAADARLQAESIQLIQERAAEMRSIGRDSLGGFISDLREGKSASEALANALDKVADRLIDMSLDNLFNKRGPFGGGSGGTGLFGGAIIPGILHGGGRAGSDGYGHGRAFGSSTWAGANRYHDGKNLDSLRAGEVPAILKHDEIVIPEGKGVGSAASFVYAPTINAQGSSPEMLPAIAAIVKENNKELMRKMPGAIKSFSKKGLI